MAGINYAWPPMEERKVVGKSLSRFDGIEKASGKAKYASDQNPKDLLFAVLVTSPHAHAKIKSLDISAAEGMKGVTGVQKILDAGAEIQWAHAEILAIAAESEEIAHDAARAVKIEYEVMPHVVNGEDVAKVGDRAKPAGEKVAGDPDEAFKSAATTHEGRYGIAVLTHCCLEPHGQVIQWKPDGKIMYWPSTQNVSGIAGDLAKVLEIPETDITVEMQMIGGGFGSKFASDSWGQAAARLSKAAGGRPVKLFLDRETELAIGGVRPSAYADVKLSADKEGNVVAWESKSWASGGFTGGGMPPIPYVLTKIPHKRTDHSAVSLNAGGARAWRAPNHQQACYLTCSALEDLAAKMNMDALEFFIKNSSLTAVGRSETDSTGQEANLYSKQLRKAAEMIGWKEKWHARGKSPGNGPVKTGLGIGLHTWGGGGHRSEARVTLFPDGNVDVELGSQDLGTGTRTIIAQTAAEMLGLKADQVNVKIGSNQYPSSGASGGSTTVGGVSTATLKAAVNALEKLKEEVVAPGLGTTADQLVASNGRIHLKDNPQKGLTWKEATRKLGVRKISETGANDPRRPGGLNSSGVGGVQIAEVEVDIETGVARMKKMVAVQDIGLVINPKLASSQIYGACIMSVCGALMEERILDPHTGRLLNGDMEFYKLAGIKDIGEIEVYIDIAPEHDARGVIGLGEPPAIAGIAAIGNAVANAIGVRVPNVPLTPDRVLAALGRTS